MICESCGICHPVQYVECFLQRQVAVMMVHLMSLSPGLPSLTSPHTMKAAEVVSGTETLVKGISKNFTGTEN